MLAAYLPLGEQVILADRRLLGKLPADQPIRTLCIKGLPMTFEALPSYPNRQSNLFSRGPSYGIS